MFRSEILLQKRHIVSLNFCDKDLDYDPTFDEGGLAAMVQIFQNTSSWGRQSRLKRIYAHLVRLGGHGPRSTSNFAWPHHKHNESDELRGAILQ